MSEHTVYRCDRCGRPSEPNARLYLDVGSRMCPSGNGTETDTERIDLCHGCLSELYQARLGKMGHDEAARYVESIRLRKKGGPATA